MGFKRSITRRGFALRDVIVNSQMHAGTYLRAAARSIYGKDRIRLDIGYYSDQTSVMKGRNIDSDRLIIITDEQSHDSVPDPEELGYMINIASCKNGVGYNP